MFLKWNISFRAAFLNSDKLDKYMSKENVAEASWPWLGASSVSIINDIFFKKRTLSKLCIWKRENIDGWIFLPSNGSLNIREKEEFQKKPKLAMKFYFMKFQMKSSLGLVLWL